MRLLRLERAWRRFWFGFFDTVLERPSAEPPRELREDRLRVLLLRHDRLGDAIVSTGLLRALASLSPRVTVDVLASARNVDFFRRCRYVERVHLYERERPATLPRLAGRLLTGGYDVVIDPIVTQRSMTSLLIMLASRARHRLGFADCGLHGLTLPVPGRTKEEHVIQALSHFIEPFGLEREKVDWQPEIALTADELAWADAAWARSGAGERPRLLVNVSGGHSHREWPPDRYVSLVEAVRVRDPELAILMVGAPWAIETLERIAARAGVPSVATPEAEMVMALVATADFVFTPDTSIAHMASAFRRPAVAMYLNGTAVQWGLYGTAAVNLESETGTLEELPLEPVLDALLWVLDSSALPPPQPA